MARVLSYILFLLSPYCLYKPLLRMQKLPAKVTLFVVTSYSLFLSGWEEENSKILASVDLVDLAIVIIFAV